jgi:carbon-monoxide dehydrogenase medium subunit
LKVDATDMISDLHGTADYRANLVKVMTGRAVTAAR